MRTLAQKWGVAFVGWLSVRQIIIYQKVKFFMNRTDKLPHFYYAAYLQRIKKLKKAPTLRMAGIEAEILFWCLWTKKIVAYSPWLM